MTLTLDQVHAGDVVPELTYTVTTTTVVIGAIASRDTRPMHHDRDFAQNSNGVRDVFLNTPNQAAWFERFLTDWTGPRGRLGRTTFRMNGSVFPGDEMVISGVIWETSVDEVGCGWVTVNVSLSVDGEERTSCRARIAIPTTSDDNPWARRAERWQP